MCVFYHIHTYTHIVDAISQKPRIVVSISFIIYIHQGIKMRFSSYPITIYIYHAYKFTLIRETTYLIDENNKCWGFTHHTRQKYHCDAHCALYIILKLHTHPLLLPGALDHFYIYI